MQFEIPKIFKDSISRDPTLESCVSNALAVLFPWFQDNKLYFFPEFTDHGVDHINTVLSTAASIVTNEAQELMTPADSSAIVLSVLLHDCAMHLSWDGFQSILAGEFSATSSIIKKNEPSWPDLFRSFMHDARRWDQEKLKQVLGAVRPVREPPNTIIDATEIDRRLVGEFIRIHHARLAHEIALSGVPGPLEKKSSWIRIIKNQELPSDLIGFIARSHNLSLRKAKDYLPRARQRSYHEIHAPFVMAILRISDYLQIQSKRAHPLLLSIRSITSSISISEWKKHASTVDVHPHGDDPEALIVHTNPSDISTLFALRQLFDSMQQELDDTWATLGEVYGRNESLQPLAFNGLKIRRLQSNVSDLHQFEADERPSFMPIELRLKSAGADMFNLLVGPLYDGDSTVAIRELVQNSVDACIERVQLQEKSSCPSIAPEIFVSLDITNTDAAHLVVRDNGIGMELDTVQNYFLVAGASFRKSRWWKSNFSDENGKSSIHRSGRFGVGALAAFLMGDKVTITTRHANEKSGLGIEFTYSIDDKYIEAKRIECEIGTTVRVKIESEEILKQLNEKKGRSQPRYHWYGLETPAINLEISDASGKRSIEKKFLLPKPGKDLPKEWFKIHHSDYSEAHWSFSHLNTNNHSSRPLFCNGIYISEQWSTDPRFSISRLSPSIQINHPTLSVFDPDGNLPLNLSRNKLATKELPFQRELEKSVAEKFVAAVTSHWNKNKNSDLEKMRAFGYPGISRMYKTYGTVIDTFFAYNNIGACLLDTGLMAQIEFERIIITSTQSARKNESELRKYTEKHNALIVECSISTETKSDIEIFYRVLSSDDSTDIAFLKSLGKKIISKHICATQGIFNIATEKGRLPKYYLEGWHRAQTDSGISICSKGEIKKHPAETEILNSIPLWAEFSFIKDEDSLPITPVSEAWQRSVQSHPLLLRK